MHTEVWIHWRVSVDRRGVVKFHRFPPFHCRSPASLGVCSSPGAAFRRPFRLHQEGRGKSCYADRNPCYQSKFPVDSHRSAVWHSPSLGRYYVNYIKHQYTNLEIMYNKMKSAPVLHIEQVAHLFLNVLFCIIGTH